MLWVGFAFLAIAAVASLGDSETSKRAMGAAWGILLGPMAGAAARNWQSCRREFGWGILVFTGPLLAVAIAVQFLPRHIAILPPWMRMGLWFIGWFAWFAGGIVSYAHAFG